MILMIDNYDSFTYNLYQALTGLGADVVGPAHRGALGQRRPVHLGAGARRRRVGRGAGGRGPRARASGVGGYVRGHCDSRGFEERGNPPHASGAAPGSGASGQVVCRPW